MRTARALTVSPSMLYAGGMYLVPGGVPGPGGVYLVLWGCTWSGGCTWAQGVYLVRGVYLVWGVYLIRGVYLVWGVYLAGPRGVYLVPGGVVYLAGPGGVNLVRYSPPPVDRITDACKNITLPQLRCGR